jgi:hypothetical protein
MGGIALGAAAIAGGSFIGAGAAATSFAALAGGALVSLGVGLVGQSLLGSLSPGGDTGASATPPTPPQLAPPPPIQYAPPPPQLSMPSESFSSTIQEKPVTEKPAVSNVAAGQKDDIDQQRRDESQAKERARRIRSRKSAEKQDQRLSSVDKTDGSPTNLVTLLS